MHLDSLRTGWVRLHDDWWPRLDSNASPLAEMRHFLACCRGEAVPPVDGQGGRRVVEIVDAARRAAESGREVEV